MLHLAGQAEFVRQYMKQGTEVLVVGRLRNYEYTDDVGNQIPALQLLVKVQGVCGNGLKVQMQRRKEYFHTHRISR